VSFIYVDDLDFSDFILAKNFAKAPYVGRHTRRVSVVVLILKQYPSSN